MKKALLLRSTSTNQGTQGLFISENFRCFTMELPWRDNARQKSCIPEGLYQCSWIKSPKFGLCYTVEQVTGRSDILFHSGNLAGDVDVGFKSNSYGCILPAKRLGRINGQMAGLISRPTVLKFNEFFCRKPFLLEIKNAGSSISDSE